MPSLSFIDIKDVFYLLFSLADHLRYNPLACPSLCQESLSHDDRHKPH